MNLWLSVAGVSNTATRMRTGWCMVLLSMFGAVILAGAENTAATRTTLAISTSNTGPRTKVTLTAHVTVPDAQSVAAGVVTFRSGTIDLGSAILDGEGNASLQTDILPAGDHAVEALYQGESNLASSLSPSEQVHAFVSTVAGYTVAASPTSLSTAVGGFVDTVVTVTPNNGFDAYVSLSCEGLPVNTTCTFTPVSVLAACTSAAVCKAGTSVMQIQTQAASPGATGSLAAPPSQLRYAFILPALLGLVGLGARRRAAWSKLALICFTFAGLVSLTACAQRYRYLNHGPPANSGTPVGTYTVTIEAQSSTGSVTVTPPSTPQLTLTVTTK